MTGSGSGSGSGSGIWHNSFPGVGTTLLRFEEVGDHALRHRIEPSRAEPNEPPGDAERCEGRTEAAEIQPAICQKRPRDHQHSGRLEGPLRVYLPEHSPARPDTQRLPPRAICQKWLHNPQASADVLTTAMTSRRFHLSASRPIGSTETVATQYLLRGGERSHQEAQNQGKLKDKSAT